MHIRLLPIVAALLVCGASSLHAQVLLIVDETNPNAITITATGTAPSVSDTDTFFNGIDLLNFYTTDASASGASAPLSTLTTGDPASAGPTFDTVYSDDITTGNGDLPYLDLNLYSSTSGANETFATDEAAFSGSITYTLSASGPLPLLAGTGGTVVAGYSGDSYETIGTYIVESPEPGTWAMLLGGFALLGFCLRRKASFLS